MWRARRALITTRSVFVQVAAGEQVIGQVAALVLRPGLERGDKLHLVDQAVLQGEQPEQKMVVCGWHGRLLGLQSPSHAPKEPKPPVTFFQFDALRPPAEDFAPESNARGRDAGPSTRCASPGNFTARRRICARNAPFRLWAVVKDRLARLTVVTKSPPEVPPPADAAIEAGLSTVSR